MKKVMIFAAVAALGASAAFADDDEAPEKEAQVYDIKVVVKTTAAKNAKLSVKKNPFIEEDAPVVFRAQASQTWQGVLWGCGCEAILGSWTTVGGGEVVAGVAIWNAKKPYSILFLDDMQWRLLNAIDATGRKVEAAWTIGDSGDDSNAFLAFAGFGTLQIETKAECLSYIKTVSGNVSGWMPAPTITTPGKPGECTFCGGTVGQTDDEVERAVAWDFCECENMGDQEFTAVSGTWNFKYNKSLSSKLSKDTSILNVYKKFPTDIKTAIAAKIAEVLGSGE